MSVRTVVERAEAVGLARFGQVRKGRRWHLVAMWGNAERLSCLVTWCSLFATSEGSPPTDARWCRDCLVVLAEAERKANAA